MIRYRRILAALVTNVRAMNTTHKIRVCSIALLLVSALAVSTPPVAEAQVVALVNGAPVTEIDITQRMKIVQLTTQKSISRQESLKQMVDDHLKISVAKRYGIEPSSQDVDNAFASMAQRAHLSPQQMEQQITRQGVAPSAFKFKLKADIGWNNLIRGKFSSSLQVNEADIRNAMQSRNEPDKDASAGNIYTLYPITLVAPNGTQEGARRQEAENLRARFTSCEDGLKFARLLRGVVVREPIKRGSADLAPQLREVLDKMEVGRLTSPETTPQGIQMFALCDRKESDSDSPAKRAVRQDLFTKRFEAESKKYLEDVRRQSMIEYR